MTAESKWPPSMTDKELREFVYGYVSGMIFSSAHVMIGENSEKRAAKTMGMVFLPLFFGAVGKICKENIDNIGLIWEWNSEAFPRTINGLPMFGSCRCMNKEDWDRARKAISKELKRRETIEV